MRIEIRRKDGGVSILYLTPGASAAAEIAKWEGLHGPALFFQEINQASVPADLTFRDAWGPGCVVDLSRARTIHMGRIRKARDDELRRTDGLMARASEQGNTAGGAKLRAERQILRDIPQNFVLSGAKTPDDLKALWPEGLGAAP